MSEWERMMFMGNEGFVKMQVRLKLRGRVYLLQAN